MALVTLREGSRSHRLYVACGWLLVVAVAAYVLLAHALPVSLFSLDKGFRVSQVNDVLAYAVAILGLNLVVGFSGQLSLGQSAFIGTGAYTTIILVADHGWSYFATIPVSVGVCFVLGFLVGLPALRISGLYLAIVTLALAYVFPTIILKYSSVTGGPNGKKPSRGEAKMDPPSWFPFADAGRLASPLWIYCILLAITTGVFFLARNFLKSPHGLATIGLRDNATGAAASGVNVPIYKTMAFGVSAAFGGLAGSMLMINRPFASDVQFGLMLTVFLIVGLVIGGVGSIGGAIPAALVYVFVPYFVSDWTLDQSGMPPGLRQVSAPLFDWLEARPAGDSISGVLFGGGLLALVFLMPTGIAGGLRSGWSRVVDVVPCPRWLRDLERDRADGATPAPVPAAAPEAARAEPRTADGAR